EVRALTRAFARTTTDRGYCALGTVKSNIGHLEAASGVSQLTKVLLQLERGTLVPTINTEPRNPSLALDDTPFYLQRDVAPWPRPVLDGREAPRRALINSFGAGGGYATLLVEEYQPPPRRAAPAPLFHIIPLSARTRGSLQRLAARVHGAIAHMDELRLDDLAWTLQTGRDAMEHRLAIVATRRESLLAALAAYVAGPDTAIPGLLAGHVDDQQATAPRSGEPSALAEAWVHGAVIDWAALRTDDARRVSLPGYPFEHRSYWIETAVVAPVATTAIAPTATASSAPARSAPACSAPRHLAGLLCDRFAVALGLEPGELAATDSLHRLGLDSITTAKLRVSLEAELGMTIPMELISGIRTVGELATQLADRGAHISPAAIEGRDAVNVVDLPDLADLDDGELVRLYAHLHDSK
ncbi:MAG TPA: phosphopantetheine-binding protein, partial [Kofleriaceae bacterium]|nr:phosphopantetheine-binding protein [Kofleriaceae bacterium]